MLVVLRIFTILCWRKSGWMYSVNGKYVNVGAGGKKLKMSDAVKWMFTCDYGKDLSWS